MREIFAVFADDQASDVRTVGFEVFREAVFVFFFWWDAVIADEWVSEDENLASIRWVGEAFRVAHHTCIENYLACAGERCAE